MKGITKHLLTEFSGKMRFVGPSNQTVCLRPNGLRQTVWFLGPTKRMLPSNSVNKCKMFNLSRFIEIYFFFPN